MNYEGAISLSMKSCAGQVNTNNTPPPGPLAGAEKKTSAASTRGGTSGQGTGLDNPTESVWTPASLVPGKKDTGASGYAAVGLPLWASDGSLPRADQVDERVARVARTGNWHVWWKLYKQVMGLWGW
jgi:hypothetical protein